MYKSIRYMRIIIALVAMGVPTWALLAGYDSVFVRMQILTSLLTGASQCLLFWLVVSLVYGRIYCSTVCPLGTMADGVAAVSRQLRRKRRHYVYCPPSKRTRIIFLLITVATVIAGGTLLPTLFDPYSAYARIVDDLVAHPLGLSNPALKFTLASLAVALLTAAGVVATAWKRGRLMCNTVCPVGTVLGFVGSRPYFHIEIDPDRCINCGECERVCKSQCIKLPEKIVNTSRCVVCFDCTTVCPNSAISYRTGRYSLGMPMMQSLGGASGQSNASAPQCHKIEKEKKE